MSYIYRRDQFFHCCRQTAINGCLWTHPVALQFNRQMFLLILIHCENGCFKLPGEVGETVADLDFFEDIFQAKLLTLLFEFMGIFNNWQTPESAPQATVWSLLPEPFFTGLNQQDLC